MFHLLIIFGICKAPKFENTKVPYFKIRGFRILKIFYVIFVLKPPMYIIKRVVPPSKPCNLVVKS
jgi:hypothetical protein